MKKYALVLALFTGLAGTTALNSCKQSGEAEGNDQTEESSAAADNGQEVYVCPMQCENKTYAEGGSCDICGMELVPKSELDKEDDGHHDHDGEEGHDHGHDHEHEEDM